MDDFPSKKEIPVKDLEVLSLYRPMTVIESFVCYLSFAWNRILHATINLRSTDYLTQ